MASEFLRRKVAEEKQRAVMRTAAAKETPVSGKTVEAKTQAVAEEPDIRQEFEAVRKKHGRKPAVQPGRDDLPRLVLPSLENTDSRPVSGGTDIPKAGPLVPAWAQSMSDRYKPENNQNIRENPIVTAEKQRRITRQDTGNFLDRLGAVASGAAKTYGASLASGQANLYDLTQGGRDTMNREFLEAAQLKYEQAKRDYEETAALAERYPENAGYQRDLEASHNMLEAAQRELKAYGVASEVQREAAEKSYEAADQLAASGQKDVEKAKAGLSKLGQFAVDVGVGGLQLGADIAGGYMTGAGTMLPLLARAYGGGAQEARQEGATAEQAAVYGAASALTEALTEKISSLGKFNTKAFGSGALDDILEGAVAAVERMGKTEAGRNVLNHAASAGIGFLSEGAEEFVSGVVSPLLKRAVYSNEKIDWKNTIQDAAYEFLVGGGIGAVSGGIGGTNTGDIQQSYLSGATERAQNDAYRTMAENGMFSQAGRNATQDALAQMDDARERAGLTPPSAAEQVKSDPTAADGQKNAAPVGAENTQVSADASLVDKIRNAVPQMQNMKPVAEVNGTELPQGGRLVDRLVQFVNSIGNKVNRPGFGDVLFSRGKIKSSMVGHGMGGAKIETFAAVPAVIQTPKVFINVLKSTFPLVPSVLKTVMPKSSKADWRSFAADLLQAMIVRYCFAVLHI